MITIHESTKAKEVVIDIPNNLKIGRLSTWYIVCSSSFENEIRNILKEKNYKDLLEEFLESNFTDKGSDIGSDINNGEPKDQKAKVKRVVKDYVKNHGTKISNFCYYCGKVYYNIEK